MQTPDAFSGYAAKVAAQLRWKKARAMVEREMLDHLCSQRDALEAQGMAPADAERESLRRTGNAEAIGAELDRVHRPRPAWGIFALVALLLACGFAVKLFLTYDSDSPSEPLYMLAAALIGSGALAATYFTDFSIIGRLPLAVFLGPTALVVLASVLSPLRRGAAYYGTYAALLLPLAYAALLYWLRGRKYGGMTLAALGLAVLAARHPAILERLRIAVTPALEPDGRGWQALGIRELLAGAKFIGQGEPCANNLSTAARFMQTDYLLAYLIHNLGWIAFAAVSCLFAALFICGFRLCMKQRSTLGRLVSFSVMATLFCETLVYFAANLGFAFILPVSLPFLSYGNTATVVNMALAGVMLSVFRTGALACDKSTNSARRLRIRLNVSFK